MKSIYYREQKHICGKSYATAPYMEVDLYPVTPKQHKAGRRAKRKEACTLAQQTYNDNRAKRYHVQLVNANFGKGDFSWTGTYDDDHHPEPGDTAKADRDLTNYIKRLYRWCDKNGIQRPKWVAATEYCTVQEDGTACGRHHHHAIIQHTDGLTRDVLEQLWADKAGQIGFTRCECPKHKKSEEQRRQAGNCALLYRARKIPVRSRGKVCLFGAALYAADRRRGAGYPLAHGRV